MNRWRPLLPLLLMACFLITAQCARQTLPSSATRALQASALRYAPMDHSPSMEQRQLRRSVLGHPGLAADWRYVSAVLMIGEREHRGIVAATPWAHRMLEESLLLDPRFEPPLRLGAVVLTVLGRESAGLARDFARRAGPLYRGKGAGWKPALWEGQAAYFSGDYSGSREALLRALQGGGPPWIEGLLTHATARSAASGQTESSTLRATADFLRATTEEEKNPDWRATTLAKARLLEDFADLLDAAARYRSRTGRAPAQLSDLSGWGRVGAVPESALPSVQFTLDPAGNLMMEGLLLSEPERSIPPH